MNYIEVYKVVLDFHRKYSNILNTDEYWNSVVSESDMIARRYENCRFVRDLLLAVINELERKAKEMIKNADTAEVKVMEVRNDDECRNDK